MCPWGVPAPMEVGRVSWLVPASGAQGHTRTVVVPEDQTQPRWAAKGVGLSARSFCCMARMLGTGEWMGWGVLWMPGIWGH